MVYFTKVEWQFPSLYFSISPVIFSVQFCRTWGFSTMQTPCYTTYTSSYIDLQWITEKAMAPHSSTLAWKIPWTEEPGKLQSMGSLRVRQTERFPFHFSLSCIGEENGNPLQCSCLENPRKGEPGGLPSIGSHRVGHDCSDLAVAAVNNRAATSQMWLLRFWNTANKNWLPCKGKKEHQI